MSSNLPPGITESMLPGNTPEDILWEKLYDKIYEDSLDMCLDPKDAHKIWELGKTEWVKTQA